MSDAAAIAAAVTAAVTFAASAVQQQRAAATAPEAESLRPRLIIDLLHRRSWLLGVSAIAAFLLVARGPQTRARALLLGAAAGIANGMVALITKSFVAERGRQPHRDRSRPPASGRQRPGVALAGALAYHRAEPAG